MKKNLLNLLEPASLVDAFLSAPPEGFTPAAIEADSNKVPGFLTRLDLATTAGKGAKEVLQRLGFLVPKPKTLFIGTTVSEYALFPDGVSPLTLKKTAIAKLRQLKASFLIIKDIPCASPLLTEKENRYAKELVVECEKSGFIIMRGLSLAYVPINFASTEEFLRRFSQSRRKDFKRKLRSFSDITVEAVPTGAPFFDDAAVEFLYGLFLNVYNQSEVHFDRLTVEFFKTVFADKKSGGMVFLYRHAGRIIGFNLCFVSGGRMVDKYVGFVYPDAREHNLYFLSWFYNLDYCVKNGLKAFIAGWTDPKVKAYLGAEFTRTLHAVYIKNPLLRVVLKRFKGVFESDEKTPDRQPQASACVLCAESVE